MAAIRVELTCDTYLCCLTHAMSTEREEVMGLLLGEVRPIHSISDVTFIHVHVHVHVYIDIGGRRICCGSSVFIVHDEETGQTTRQGRDISRAAVIRSH